MTETYNKSKNKRVPAFLSWLFPYKRKGLSINTQSSIAFYIFQNKISLILINWLFQGMRSMGKADLLGKFILEIILFVIFIKIYQGTIMFRIATALITAHTINWLVNAHFWDLGRFIGITRTSPNLFFPYMHEVLNRLRENDAIVSIVVIGGVSRNAGFKETSDVDMIFIKAKGFRYSVIAVFVTMKERIKAFWLKFPLHLELYDEIQSIKHRHDEIPIILKDAENAVNKWYKKKGRKTAKLEDLETIN